MIVKLNTVELVKQFVDICNKYPDLIIKVYASDGFIVDGKSILGVFSLDLTKKLRVIAEPISETNPIVMEFYEEIRIFLEKQ